jgi:hypothetical protein
MGGSQSSLSFLKPGKISDKATLVNSTQESQQMANALWKFMHSNWSAQDLVNMSDEEKYKEYVIAISDLITNSFVVLGYTTTQNNLGEIYIRKYSDLDPKKAIEEYPEDNSAIQRSNAQIIAYHFVRIMQLVAVLTGITKINLPREIAGENQYTRNANRNFARQAYSSSASLPHFSGYSGIIPTRGQYGGAKKNTSEPDFPSRTPLGAWEFLRGYLVPVSSDLIKEYKDTRKIDLRTLGDFKNIYKFRGSDCLFFKYEQPKDATDITINTGPKQSMYIIYVEKNKAGVVVGTQSSGDITLKLKDMSPTYFKGYISPAEYVAQAKSNLSEDYKYLERFPTSVALNIGSADSGDRTVPGSGDRYVYTVEMDRQTEKRKIPKYSFIAKKNEILQTIISSVNSNLKPEDDLFVSILENIAIYNVRLGKGDARISQFERITTETQENSRGSPGGVKVPENMSLKESFKAIDQTNYAPHCVARAFKLLDPKSMFASFNDRSGEAITSICTSGIGNDGRAITKVGEYKPLQVLGHLYGKVNPSKTLRSLIRKGDKKEVRDRLREYNKIAELELKKVQGLLAAFVGKNSNGNTLKRSMLNEQPTELAGLTNAIERLSKAFDSSGSNLEFDDIQIKTPGPSDNCSSTKELTIQRNSVIFSQLQSVAHRLLAHHVNNTRNIMKFMKEVFNIKQRPDNSWEIEGPNVAVLLGGSLVLDKLTNQGRELALNYWTGCESLYQEGLAAWGSPSNDAVDKKSVQNPVAVSKQMLVPQEKMETEENPLVERVSPPPAVGGSRRFKRITRRVRKMRA